MRLKALLLGLAVAMFSVSSFAVVDVTAATTSFTDTATAVNSIGPLMLTAVGAGIVFKWVLGFIIG